MIRETIDEFYQQNFSDINDSYRKNYKNNSVEVFVEPWRCLNKMRVQINKNLNGWFSQEFLQQNVRLFFS